MLQVKDIQQIIKKHKGSPLSFLYGNKDRLIYTNLDYYFVFNNASGDFIYDIPAFLTAGELMKKDIEYAESPIVPVVTASIKLDVPYTTIIKNKLWEHIKTDTGHTPLKQIYIGDCLAVTNGHTLYREKLTDKKTDKYNLIPAELFKNLSKHKFIEAFSGETYCKLCYDGFTVIYKKPDYQYPNINQVISEKFAHELYINCDELKTAIKTLLPYTNKDTKQIVFCGNKMSAKNRELNLFKAVDFSVSFPLSIAFNGDLMLQIINNIGKNFYLQINGNLQAACYSTKDKFLWLQMPLRMLEEEEEPETIYVKKPEPVEPEPINTNDIITSNEPFIKSHIIVAKAPTIEPVNPGKQSIVEPVKVPLQDTPDVPKLTVNSQAIENSVKPATKRQLWYLYCITKQDYRTAGLNKSEASQLISDLLSKRKAA